MSGSDRLDELLDAELWDRRGRPQRGDGARLDALVDGAMGAGPPPGDGGSSPHPRPGLGALAIVAATGVLAVIGSGTWLRGAPLEAREATVSPIVGSSERAPPREPVLRRAERVPRAASGATMVPPHGLESTRSTRSTDVDDVAGEAAAPDDIGGPSSSRSPVARDRLDAATLLRLASRARDDGRPRRAMRLYTRLFREYPKSREAATARVSAGRLELDVHRRARPALRHFERCIREQPDGTLAEQAMVGRALALGRLKRPAEERRAWQQLIDRFPTSVHGARARMRVGAVGGDAATVSPSRSH